MLAPGVPGFKIEVEALRENPSVIANLTVPETVAHLERVITGLDRPPIIIGHSFGGTPTQLLLARGLGAAGVAINSAPTERVLVNPPSQIKALFPILKNRANHSKAVGFTPEEFHHAFINTLSEEESAKGLRALSHPRAGTLGVGVWCVRESQARPSGDVGRLPRPKPGTAPVHRRWCGPHQCPPR